MTERDRDVHGETGPATGRDRKIQGDTERETGRDREGYQIKRALNISLIEYFAY